MRYLPANCGRSRITRFDLPSAIMNALTFGLLIVALGGFAQGQSGQLVLAELAAMLVIGFFFIRRQLRMPVPLAAG
nr:transport protein [Raoultella sp. NCTC 9187]